MDSFAGDDSPIDLVASVLPDDDGSLILWHTRGIGMHKRVFHQNAGDFSKRLVRSVVGTLRFPRNRIHTEVFLEGRVRWDFDLVFSSTFQVQNDANHIFGHCARVDSARYR